MLGENIQVLDTSLTGISLLEYVNAEYEAKKLALPYVPDHLVSSIQQTDSRYFFATEAALPLQLDFVPGWVQAIMAPDNEEQGQLMKRDYLFFGEAGYGVNSYFFYYYLHWGPVYLFYNHPFGGIYQDQDADATSINTDLGGIAATIARCVERPVARGEAAVVIADSKPGHYGWGVISDGELEWQDGELADALKALSEPSGQ